MTSELNIIFINKENGNLRSTVLIPIGTVVLWSGSLIPSGWSLCDGSNNTPNLINRFIKGGKLNEISNIGNRSTYKLSIENLPSHSHGATCSITNSGDHDHDAKAKESGNHYHAKHQDNYEIYAADTPGLGTTRNIWRYETPDNTSRDGKHTHNFTTSTDGDHNHMCTVKSSSSGSNDGKTANTGGAELIDNEPQYYILAYIMKI